MKNRDECSQAAKIKTEETGSMQRVGKDNFRCYLRGLEKTLAPYKVVKRQLKKKNSLRGKKESCVNGIVTEIKKKIQISDYKTKLSKTKQHQQQQ